MIKYRDEFTYEKMLHDKIDKLNDDEVFYIEYDSYRQETVRHLISKESMGEVVKRFCSSWLNDSLFWVYDNNKICASMINLINLDYLYIGISNGNFTSSTPILEINFPIRHGVGTESGSYRAFGEKYLDINIDEGCFKEVLG